MKSITKEKKLEIQILNELECLKPIKRKSISFLKAKWGYKLLDTDFYLICRIILKKRPVYFANQKVEYHRNYTWSWIKVNADYCGNIIGYKVVEADSVFSSKVPKELLFNLDIFEGLVRIVNAKE